MKIEIITTGDELMNGLTIDANFRWAADRLTALGFRLAYHTTVGDDKAEISEALATAFGRAQAVIVSGGLGPTPDDLTAEVAAGFFKVPLEFNAVAFRMIQERFEKQGRQLLEINKKQAYIPKGAKNLSNFWGTAPGFQYIKEGVPFFFLPGVPKEFKAMVDEYVIAELDKRDAQRKKYRTRLIRTFGLRESEVADKLKGIDRADVRIGYRAHFPEIHLKISAWGETKNEAEILLTSLTGDIVSRLREYVFSTEGEMLEEVVGKLLTQKNLTLAAAESCTGGLLANRITNVSGSSRYFERGVVTYSNESKTEVLGVPKKLIELHGAVSAEVVEAMAEGVRKFADTDLGIGISGIAGPGGGTPQKPVGSVFIGISHIGKGIISRRFLFRGTREEIKLHSSQAALDLLRKSIINDV